MEVEILDWSKNWIDTRVKSDTDHIFGRFTWLYGTPYNAEKTAFWEGTREWDKGDQTPWIVSGDMNEVLWNFEKQGGAPWNPRRRRYLLEFMESNSLFDLGFSGQCFTWEKKCTDNVVVRERLDRSLGNADWVLCWPNTLISHGLRVGSDHVPLIIDNSPSLVREIKCFGLRLAGRIIQNVRSLSKGAGVVTLKVLALQCGTIKLGIAK